MGEEIAAAKRRVNAVWKINCDYVSQQDKWIAKHDRVVGAKDEEIARLRLELKALKDVGAVKHSSHEESSETGESSSVASDKSMKSPRHDKSGGRKPSRKGKAPPVDPYTDKNKEITLDE